MAGYIIVQVDVHDAERFAVYRDMVPPTLEAFGGRYLARGGDTQTLDGDWAPKRIVILEFDSVERAKAWWNSDLYAPAKKLREESASSTAIVTEGCAE